MECWQDVMDQAEAHDHFVQFYKADEPLLNRNVGRYLWEGLLRGDALIVIATPQRQESLKAHLSRMGGDVTAALADGQLVVLDAQATLDLFMVNGLPHPRRFEDVVEKTLGIAKRRSPAARVRAYGEMVGLLWEEGRIEAAIQLEEFWNAAIHAHGITLFCGYPIDVFGSDMSGSDLQALIRAHTHLLPAGADEHMHEAVHQAMHDVLGPAVATLKIETRASVAMPAPEATIAWLRKNVPEKAEDILSRARDYYQCAACAA